MEFISLLISGDNPVTFTHCSYMLSKSGKLTSNQKTGQMMATLFLLMSKYKINEGKEQAKYLQILFLKYCKGCKERRRRWDISERKNGGRSVTLLSALTPASEPGCAQQMLMQCYKMNT